MAQPTRVTLSLLFTKQKLLDALNPKIDQHLFYPYSNSSESLIKIMRI